MVEIRSTSIVLGVRDTDEPLIGLGDVAQPGQLVFDFTESHHPSSSFFSDYLSLNKSQNLINL